MENTDNSEKDGGSGGLSEDITDGIHSNSVQVHLIMEMGSGRPAGRPDQPDGFAPLHVLARFYDGLFEMSIFGLKALAVLDDDDPAVSTIPAGE